MVPEQEVERPCDADAQGRRYSVAREQLYSAIYGLDTRNLDLRRSSRTTIHHSRG